MTHVPVMTREVVDHVQASRGGLFLDFTVGLGGHSRALLEAGATRVIGFDRDLDAIAMAEQTLAPWRDRVQLVHADFRSFADVLERLSISRVSGAVADLGVSSLQLEAAGRGFSFQRDEPLDMRMDRTAGETAADLVARATQVELADAIFGFGEERFSRRIARAIVDARGHRPVATTGQLASIVRRVVPHRGRPRLDPATRTFQALRIWVNRELEGLDRFLEAAARRLEVSARLVVIAFHSLEDRIVKHTFRALERGVDVAMRVLTKKPVVPRDEEVRENPRARSAKLRAVERVNGAPTS
ncbi:MAG TPA: 16S rRNA (cytosine(1402)-N(4))-methyltransferase RsmH [Vicinamibacterales bacterium]|jgi:16S rRNA (cytosine1402-N4)-methyltransferase|nr:16S rRNA (cytosine(1402)-N(4))-methyltransferase RsmH [Vicinamibacterales bacterium]